MSLEQSFVELINRLEDEKDLEKLKIELYAHIDSHMERFYISSAISFIMNKTAKEVEDLFL